MIKIKAILKLLFSKQYVVITDKHIIGNSSAKFYESAMFSLMDANILELEQRQAVEEAKEILNLIK